MQIGKVKLVSTILVLVLIAILVEGYDTKDRMPTQTRITVTDLAGREVSVTTPVEKVVLGYAKHLLSFAAVAGEGFSMKIGGWAATRPSEYDQDTYLKFKEKYPEIEGIPDVGSHAQGTFSVEKVISVKPDVVIFPLWMLNNQYEGTTEDIARMQRVGIPTILIDCWEKPFKNTIPSILLLGTLLGKEKRAQEIADFCQKRVNEVISRQQKIKKPKPKVYVENGVRGRPWTCGNYAWGTLVIKAGGINIAEGIIKRWGQISPEYLLKTNPDVIIIAGPEPPRSMRHDYQADAEGSRLLLKAFTERTGWHTFSAVKSGRVYGVFDSYIIYNIYNFAAIEALAKWFYPDEYKNLNPETNLKEFYAKFMPVEYSGAWMTGIQD